MQLICHNGFPKIYTQLQEGVGSICHGYICIVLYMKCMWCNGFPDTYARLEEGVGQSAMVYVHCAIYICETYLVSWFSKDLCLIGGGGGINLPWIYVHCTIYETDVV